MISQRSTKCYVINMSLQRRILLLVIFLGLCNLARADMRFDFSRNNQTYDWLTTINHSITGPRLQFNAAFNGESNLIKGNTSTRWQENATAGFNSKVSLLNRLSFITTADYTINGLDRRRVRSSGLIAGFSYRPKDYIELEPVIRADRRHRSDFGVAANDQGVGYGFRVGVNPILGGVVLNTSLSYDKINLTNIPSEEGNGELSGSTRFFGRDSLSFAVKGMESSKKYYSASSQGASIVRQIKQEREGNFGVTVHLPAALRLQVDSQARLSRYLYRYPIEDAAAAPQRDNYGKGGGYKTALSGHIKEFALGVVSYTWGKTSQDYQGINLDQNSESGELAFQGKITLSPRDSLSADAVFGVTSYKNPSLGANRRDRDQKTIIINGRINHLFSRFFMAGISGGASSFHQIYISGAQSANNGTNDTYILTPYSTWAPSEQLRVTQTFEIQANYITFDYDRKKRSTRNRIFRRATARTDLTYIFNSRFTWQQGYTYRYEDYGQLIWDEGWQQAVSWDRRRNGLETKFIYRPKQFFQITPSFAWEKTSDFTHSVELSSELSDLREFRRLSEEQVKMLLQIDLVFQWSERRSLRADLSRRIRKFMTRPREINDFVTFSMEYLF